MTSLTRRPLPMASTGCACCAPATPDATPGSGSPAPAAPAPSRTYRVDGMTCGHCAGRVTDAITALEGVTDVHVELVPGGTSAVVVSGSAAPQAVQAAVEQAGYTTAQTR
ncbi:cation transporter [Kocuria kalidii]|uniref:heavy-metal-associated domain-containing protein n=1 Tax=Kocuria kalidii TaxID=3376283 RepID=UPI0037A8EF99